MPPKLYTYDSAKQRMMLKPSEKLAYWVGVAQSDGYLKKYRSKATKNVLYLLSLDVSEPSLLMLRRFQVLSSELFNRNASIFKRGTRHVWSYHIGIGKLLPIFEKLDISFGRQPRQPSWCKGEPEFLGAYLAGLIDGDGDVRIKRSRYPQCVIRITSGFRQSELAKAIRETLQCSVAITFRKGERVLKGRKIHGTWYEMEFYVSLKNHEFIEQFVLPHLMLPYKKVKLETFIDSKWSRGNVADRFF